LRINVDFWTTNYNQKLELIEQLGTLFNPSLEIQSTDNFIDWTSLSVVYQDGLTFSSRSIPQGTGNPIDVMSWKFYMPIWISTSAKLKKQGVIHKVIASIFNGKALQDMQDDDLLLGTRQKITPYGYNILYMNGSLQLLPADQPFYVPNSNLNLPSTPNTSIYWSAFLNAYGAYKSGVTQIWLQNPYMDTEIVGTIVIDPVDDRLAIFSVDTDTLPQNTLDPVDSVVNPLTAGPFAGLPAPLNGTRYLLVVSIGGTSTTTAWGNLVANANDIIEYDESLGEWIVVFDSQSTNTVEYVTNLTSGIQYRFVDQTWMKSYEGFYEAGDFSVVM